jgi:hypothetical protein
MEWVRNESASFRQALIALVFILLLAVVVLAQGGPPQTDFPTLILWWLVVVGVVLLALNFPLSTPLSIGTDPRGLGVHWPFRVRIIPWSDIREVVASEVGGFTGLGLRSPSYKLIVNLPEWRTKAIGPLDASVVEFVGTAIRAQGTLFKVLGRTKSS